MEQHLFRYQLVRYIADLRRMEPQNFGVIVQGATDIRCQFNPYFGRKSGFDSKNLRAWRDFFRSEIEGKAVPLFQPERLSIDFLEYLQNQSHGNYSVTRPYEIVMSTGDIQSVTEYLFKTLVHTTEEKEVVVTRPVSRFRQELEKRNLENNQFLLKNQIFSLTGNKREIVEYQYERNHGADMPVLVQSVPWIPKRIQDTKGRLESAQALVRSIKGAGVRAEVHIVMDRTPAPEKNEDEGRAFLRQQYDATKIEFSDVLLADDPEGAVQLVEQMETDLKDLEESDKEKKRSGALALG